MIKGEGEYLFSVGSWLLSGHVQTARALRIVLWKSHEEEQKTETFRKPCALRLHLSAAGLYFSITRSFAQPLPVSLFLFEQVVRLVPVPKQPWHATCKPNKHA